MSSIHRVTRFHSIALALSSAGALLSAFAPSATAGAAIGTDRIAAGLTWPTYVTHVPGDTSRVFVLEKQGRIRIIDITTDTLLAASYLDINALVINPTGSSDERGLLGLAFHPNYATNGFFYVNYTANSGSSTVARYTVSGDPATSNVANAASATTLLTLADPFSNHNGGWIAFGPNDGYLYIATGDGGSACDPGQRAQDITGQSLGKMLRIDVDGGVPYAIPPTNPFVAPHPGDDNIWAYGLRNPWRPSFDRSTGDLLIADVGQGAWEEINFQPASSAGGENYGWNCREGTACSGCAGVACACAGAVLTAPKHAYSHASGCSITGGYVYRGCAIDGLQGLYFFADYCSNITWSATISAGGIAGLVVRTGELSPSIDGFTVGSIASFGEDALGEMYIADHAGGEIFRIIPDVITDCNTNGDNDTCDIASGLSDDVNANAIPDECECLSDLDGSGDTGFGDVAELLLHWGPCGAGPGCPWDLDGSGDVGFGDYTVLLLEWGAC